MEKTKLLTIAVIGLLLLNLGTLAVIMLKSDKPHHRGMPPPRGEGPRNIIIEKLKLDHEQQKQYELLIEDHRKKTREFNDISNELHEDLYALLSKDSAGTEKEEIIQKILQNQKDIEHLNFEHFRAIRAICNESQIPLFNELSHDLTDLFGHKGPPPGRK
jgi:Spy/CpxP family protein refolding chaperone